MRARALEAKPLSNQSALSSVGPASLCSPPSLDHDNGAEPSPTPASPATGDTMRGVSATEEPVRRRASAPTSPLRCERIVASVPPMLMPLIDRSIAVALPDRQGLPRTSPDRKESARPTAPPPPPPPSSPVQESSGSAGGTPGPMTGVVVPLLPVRPVLTRERLLGGRGGRLAAACTFGVSRR